MTAQRARDELLEAARLYYIDGLQQSEVASKLHTSRSNVSRMLRAAREQGVIRFLLSYPTDRDARLEQDLMERWGSRGLRTALVLKGESAGTNVDPRQCVGSMTARWLLSHISDGHRITVCWGRSLRATVNQIMPERVYDVHVSQLGGDLHLEPFWSSHEMVREAAVRLGASYSYLHAPAFMDSAKAADSLLRDRAVAQQLAVARQSHTAIVGVGAFDIGSNREFITQAHVSMAELKRAREMGVVGEMCGRFYDAAGSELNLPIRHRVIAVSLRDLTAIPTVVALATGWEKGPAVAGALTGGLANVLICDTEAAHAALAADAPDHLNASPRRPGPPGEGDPART